MTPRLIGLMLLIVVAVLAVACGPDVALSEGEPPAEGAVAWRHLGQVEGSLDAGLAGAAVQDPARFADAWAANGFDGDAPVVDFADRVVLLLGQADDACPDELVGLEVGDGRLEVEWLPPPGGCNQPQVMRLHAVEVHRGHLPTEFSVGLREPFETELGQVTIALPPYGGSAPPVPEPPAAMTQEQLDAVFAGHAVRRCTPDDARIGEPQVDGPLSDDRQVATAQEARVRIGVPSDAATTAGVLADHAVDRDAWGAPLLPDEIAAEQERDALASRLSEWLGVAGWDLDREATVILERFGDGRVHVEVAQHRVATLQGQVDEQFGPGAVVVDAAPYPPEEVRAAQEALGALMGPGGGPGIITSTSGLPGPLQIGMVDPTREALDAIAATVDPELVCVHPELSGVTAPAR